METAQGKDLRDMRVLHTCPDPDRWLLTHPRGSLLVDLAGEGELLDGPAAFVPGGAWIVAADGEGVLHLRDPAGAERGTWDPGFRRFGALVVGPGREIYASSRHYIRRLPWPEGWPAPDAG